ncbi:MAG TPA: hypothetical protein VHI32_06245 [Burkholderiales bacterium]|jgi:hypothetical protein|nr:hypothetical protein [Burkholderiales bacterium]
MKALRFAAQLALYAPLMAILAYFSTEPRFSVIAPGEALVRVSFIHATQRRQACRERTPEELAKLAPNMRAALDCPRERSPLLVEVELDGRLVLRREVQPSGLRRDGNAVVYERMALPAGRHRIVARLRDRAEGDFNFMKDETVELAGGQTLIIDFNAAKGGFAFLI